MQICINTSVIWFAWDAMFFLHIYCYSVVCFDEGYFSWAGIQICLSRWMTLKINIETAKVVEFIKFDIGNIVMVTGGWNRGHIGVIQHHEKHKGSSDVIHVVDAAGHQFATWMGNVFTVGQRTSPCLHFPKARYRAFYCGQRARSGLLEGRHFIGWF